MWKDSRGNITLDFSERKQLEEHFVCPNCGHRVYEWRLRYDPKHPVQGLRFQPRHVCPKCHYWSDWFDTYCWHPDDTAIGESGYVNRVETTGEH